MRQFRYIQRSLVALGRCALLTLTGTLTACDLLGPGDERFIIPIDSIDSPDVIAPGQVLTLQFYGGVGPDGCSRLDRVDKRLTNARLEITFRGIRSNGSCTQMPVYLDYTETVPPPIQSPFTVYAIQPRGPALQRVVTVGSD